TRARTRWPQVGWQWEVKFDKDHQTVNTIIEDACWFGAADPREPGVIQVLADFVHLNPRVSIVHVVYVQCDQINQLFPLLLREFGGSNAGVIQDYVVLESFSQVVVSGLGDL